MSNSGSLVPMDDGVVSAAPSLKRRVDGGESADTNSAANTANDAPAAKRQKVALADGEKEEEKKEEATTRHMATCACGVEFYVKCGVEVVDSHLCDGCFANKAHEMAVARMVGRVPPCAKCRGWYIEDDQPSTKPECNEPCDLHGWCDTCIVFDTVHESKIRRPWSKDHPNDVRGMKFVPCKKHAEFKVGDYLSEIVDPRNGIVVNVWSHHWWEANPRVDCLDCDYIVTAKEKPRRHRHDQIEYDTIYTVTKPCKTHLHATGATVEAIEASKTIKSGPCAGAPKCWVTLRVAQPGGRFVTVCGWVKPTYVEYEAPETEEEPQSSESEDADE